MRPIRWQAAASAGKPLGKAHSTVIYLIGGPTGVGKSCLRGRLLGAGIPGICTDMLVRSVGIGAPSFGLTFRSEPGVKRTTLRPFIEGVCSYHPEIDFVIEGDVLVPDDFETYLRAARGQARMLVLGTAQIGVDAKLERAASHPSYNEWISWLDEAHRRRTCLASIEESVRLRAVCGDLSVPYVDTSGDFDAAMEQAMAGLLSA